MVVVGGYAALPMFSTCLLSEYISVEMSVCMKIRVH